MAAIPAQSSAQARLQVESPPPVEESLAFIGQLGEVLNVQVAGMKKLLDAKPLFDSMTSPAGVKAGAPKVRALMAEAEAMVRQADSMTGRIVPPPGLRYGTLEPATMLAEVRSQNAKCLELLGEFDAFLRAAERGDRAAAMKMAPRLMEGSFLLIDGNASMYRNRQAALPSTHSIYQALDIGVQLYRSMSVSGRAWIAAKFGNRPDSAAATLRAQLGEIAVRARAASAEGRANLARELSEFDRKTEGLRFRGEEAETMARFRRAFAGKEKLFAVGDEIASIAGAAARVSGAELAAQPSPQLLGRFMPLEIRFQGALAEQAAIATGKAQ
ncbi:MAG TPA: hypothetical protein VF759_14815 [Allosphingosinicella sp.]